MAFLNASPCNLTGTFYINGKKACTKPNNNILLLSVSQSINKTSRAQMRTLSRTISSLQYTLHPREKENTPLQSREGSRDRPRLEANSRHVCARPETRIRGALVARTVYIERTAAHKCSDTHTRPSSLCDETATTTALIVLGYIGGSNTARKSSWERFYPIDFTLATERGRETETETLTSM